MQKIEQVKPESVHNRDEVLRDHFINGIRDTILRRELKKSVNERPALTFLHVRMIAMQWIDDVPALPTLQTVNKISTVNNPEIDDLKAIVKVQQKTISELTEAVKKLTEHQVQALFLMTAQDNPCSAFGVAPTVTWQGHVTNPQNQPGPSLRPMEVQFVEIDEAAGSEVVERLSEYHVSTLVRETSSRLR